ncbi:hypothetical protein JCM10914A_55880 [Paenibacillus sp. JCM 10914]|uniref:hypothetical protein n=1 Tax=Paenibacillus sp. JCM 10914 TaxID=1236974 RepID=UPI0003CCA718|nr:hypothetical protein [Paenibacillus sp. JCM 10914]GAE09610.1 hypothetical protein JCM10914_5979 [Paenibacillus sp. JCM 10914]
MEKVLGEVNSITPSTTAVPMHETELKLDYLRQLRELRGHTTHEGITERILKVLDSIEDDLGINKETVAGNIVVKLFADVDTSKLEYGFRKVSEKTTEHAERLGNALRDAAKRISES